MLFPLKLATNNILQNLFGKKNNVNKPSLCHKSTIYGNSH